MAIQLNGTTFNGTQATPATPFPPSKIDRRDTKIGKTKVAASGKRCFVSRNAVKPDWTLSWEDVGVVTRNAVKGIAALNTTFAFVDEQGTSWTVQCEEDGAYADSTTFTDFAGNIYYSVTLTFHIAT